MADTITVKFKVMEDGSLKAVGKDADRAAAALDKTSKSTDKATRSADKYSKKNKGVAGATSNSTKAFSKMTTGIQGGLVPAYATLAANVFALTAVFGTLSRIDAVSKLEKGLEFVGRASGRNLKLVAEGLKEITGNAVSAEQAMRTTAVGISAGFSEGQMKGLAEVAKGASLALGRDMADAMDRLTRGAAKLEPEILDELGIMVRLDDAVDKYAQRHNKAASELTQFERRQAFTNAILEDGRKKFQDITDAIDPSAYSKLAAAFQDLTKTVIGGLNTALNPLIDFFSGAPAALAGVAAVFGGGLVNTLIGGLQGIASGAAEAAERTEDHAKAALKGIKPHEKMGKAFNEVAKSADRGDDALKRMLKSVNMSINMTSKDTAKLKIATKARNALTKEIFRQELAETKRNLAGTLGTLQTFGATEAFRSLGTQLGILRVQTLSAAAGQSLLNRVFILGSGAATAFAATIRLVGASFLAFLPYIGLAVAAFTLLMPYFKKPESKLDQVLKKNTERLAEFTEVVNQYVDAIKKTEDPNAKFMTTLKAMSGLQTEAQTAIQNVLNASDSSANSDYFIAEAEVKAHSTRVNSIIEREKEYTEFIEKERKKRSNKAGLRGIMEDARKEFGDFRFFGKAAKELRSAQNDLEDATDKFNDMEKIDPAILFAQEGAAGVRKVAIEFSASLNRMNAELDKHAAEGKDVTNAQENLAQAMQKTLEATEKFNQNPTRENAIALSEAFKLSAESSNAAVDSVKTYDDTLSALKKNLDVQTGTLGKYGKTLDLVDAAINRVNSVGTEKGEGQAAIMAEEVNDLLENYKKLSKQGAETEVKALERYRKELDSLNTSITNAAKETDRLNTLEAAGAGATTSFMIEKVKNQDQILTNIEKEIKLTQGLENRNKLELDYNDALRERIKLNDKKTKKLVGNARSSGMGEGTAAVVGGVGIKENIDMLAKASEDFARRNAEHLARELEKAGNTAGAAAARAAGEKEVLGIRSKAADNKKGISGETAKNAMSGFAQDLAAIGPEGELMSSVIQGALDMQTAFTTAFEVMGSGSASMSDKIAAGLGATMALASSMRQMQKAASDAKLMEIDNEIARERQRDGASAASINKIKALEAKKEQEKKKAFEQDKKMKRAQTIMATAQAVMQAFAMGGPIVGAIMSAFIIALGAKQLSLINSQTYTGGGGGASGGTPSVSAGSRSNTVDLATSNNAGGELAYSRGAEGTGNMSNFKPAFSGYKHRASGGYIVGEQGPEIFMPDTPGEIISSGKTPEGQTNVNFSINAVDAAGVEDLLINQRGNIIGMIREAANEHGELFLESVREKSY